MSESNPNSEVAGAAGRTRPGRSAPVLGHRSYSKRNWFFGPRRRISSAPEVKECFIEMMFHLAEMVFIRWRGCASDGGCI